MNEVAIFNAALKISDSAERAAFLEKACGDDAKLCTQIEELLKAHDDAGSFLDKPAADISADDAAALTRVQVVGHENATMPSAPKEQSMVPDPIELFMSAVKKSGLVAAKELLSHSAEIKSAGADSQEEVAKKLVEKNVLTAYQAERLLAGQGEDCILGGRYHILEKIGAGGMGNVFRALDTQLNRIVAVKVMSAHNLSDADAVVRFKREARALAQLALPNVVQAFDSGEDHGRNFLVMEFVQGVGLNDLVKQKGPIPPTVAADYIYQVAIGMQRAHERGMIHRDIKPGNMILAGDGQVKILDLGLAKFLQDQIPDGELTRDNIGLGTPDYMPPEQFRDARNVDSRADIYSLGCTLYYLIAGQVPFPGSSFLEKAHAHETKQPIGLEEHCPQVPAGLSLAVERMMAKRPADRYQTMRDVANALAAYVAGSSPSLPSVKQTVSFMDSQIVRSRRRGALMAWIGGGTVVVAAIAMLAVFLPFFFGSTSPGKGEIVKDDVKNEGQKKLKGLQASKTKKKAMQELRVLTVSKDPRDEAQFDSINAALEKVKPGMTIRVLDKAKYAENISINRKSQHAGITLEAIQEAVLVPSGRMGVAIKNVPSVTMRGFQFQGDKMDVRGMIIAIGYRSPGAVIDGLKIGSAGAGNCVGIDVEQLPLSENDDPVLVQNCEINDVLLGIRISGIDIPAKGIVIRKNRFAGTRDGVALGGEIHNCHIVANRFEDVLDDAVEIGTASANSRNIFIANNTFFATNRAITIYEKAILAKNVRIHNNLVLSGTGPDMVFVKGKISDDPPPHGAMDGALVHKSWIVSHNWREGKKPAGNTVYDQAWIPPGPSGVLKDKIAVLSRTRGDANFLRPGNDSPLAKEGTGKDDPSLPVYIGAVPPEGVPPWDWNVTWKVRTTNTLTVSQKPVDGGMFRTINDALKKVQPGMTIRVLDDAVYDETLVLKNTQTLKGITIEAVKNAVIENDAGKVIEVGNVHDLTIKGFKLRTKSKDEMAEVVNVQADSPGLVLEELVFEAIHKNKNLGVAIPGDFRRIDNAKPMIVRRCRFKDLAAGIVLQGYDQSGKLIMPVDRVRIENNQLVDCSFGIIVKGACREVFVAGNRIVGARDVGIQLEHLVQPTENILVANNTMFQCGLSIRVWEKNDRVQDKKAQQKRIHICGNLILAPEGLDMIFLDSGGHPHKFKGSGDVRALVKAWRFSHNWRETKAVTGQDDASKAWIPPNEKEKDVISDKIDVLSRDVNQANFLQPAKDSALAKAGIGKDGLPPYVGAVPPQGVDAWDWNATWQARTNKKKPTTK